MILVKKGFFTLIIILNFSYLQYAQQYLKLDSESSTHKNYPVVWHAIEDGYEIKVDSTVFQGNRKCLRIRKLSVGSAGIAITTFPVEVAKGKHLQYSAYIKTEGVTDGYAGLWWRVDGKIPDRHLALDNMSDRGATGTTGWKKYIIEMNIDTAAQYIVFGVLNTGNGTAWFDNFQIELDGNIYEQKKPSIFIPSTDSIDLKRPKIGSSLNLKETNENTLQNLNTFAKIYGYIRFFHPSDEASKIDWDKFAVYGVAKIFNKQNENELKQVLDSLFLPIAPTMKIIYRNGGEDRSINLLPTDSSEAKSVVSRVAWQHFGVGLKDSANVLYKSMRVYKSVSKENIMTLIKNTNLPHVFNNGEYLSTKLFDKFLDTDEVINRDIDEKLRAKIPIVLYCNRKGTIGKYKEHSFDSLSARVNELPHALSSNLKAVQFADVIIAWNVFQHFYPYFDVVKVDWDSVLVQALKKIMQDKTPDDFYDTLREMVAKLQDGHGVVYYQPQRLIRDLPIRVGWIENHLVITASKDSLLMKGDIIEKLDGLNSDEALTKAEKYVSGSPQLRRFRALNILCDGTLGSTVKLQIIRDDKELTVEETRKTKNGNLFFSSIPEFVFPSIKKIGNDIYYINLASVTKEQIDDSLGQLSKAKGIIFDQRYDGEPILNKDPSKKFHPHQFIPYLIDSTVYSGWWDVPQTNFPDRQGVTYKRSHWVIQPKQPRIKTKILFINDPSVVSYGESYTEIYDYYKLAEFVGEPTAGTNGNVNFINLPGEIRIMFTGMKVLRQDGTQHHLIGIRPTYPVKRTIRAIKERRDEYLEKAIEIINNSQK